MVDMVVGIQLSEHLIYVFAVIVLIAIIVGIIVQLLLTEDTSTDYFYDDYKRFL